jgi:hypothetical protein
LSYTDVTVPGVDDRAGRVQLARLPQSDEEDFLPGLARVWMPGSGVLDSDPAEPAMPCAAKSALLSARAATT